VDLGGAKRVNRSFLVGGGGLFEPGDRKLKEVTDASCERFRTIAVAGVAYHSSGRQAPQQRAGELASALPASPSREHLNGVAFWERKPARGLPVDLPEAAPTGAEQEESAGARDERASRHIAFGRVR
jgi:hypothetical protein